MFKFKFKKTEQPSLNSDMARIISEDTPFAITESFRALYTNILYLPISDKCRKIAITSASAGEGKTYVSTNLAITLAANSNKKILLVDMDIRLSRVKRLLSERFSLPSNQTGLSEYLVGIDDEPVILKTDMPNLDILFSGKESSNPIGLLHSERMSTLFDRLSEEYDYIIIDTPPVNVVTDALLILDKVNGYILSAKANVTSINALTAATETITKVGGEVFGIVLTAVDVKKSSKSKKKYTVNNYNKG